MPCSVEEHGFEEAKQKAIAYRKRLEAEYDELQAAWREIDRYVIMSYMEKGTCRKRCEERMSSSDRRYQETIEGDFLLGDSTVV